MSILKFILLTVSIILFSYNLVSAEVFKDIKVSGNKRISIKSIIVLGNIEINKDYNERKLNTLLKQELIFLPPQLVSEWKQPVVT